jgi:hypothetical protein
MNWGALGSSFSLLAVTSSRKSVTWIASGDILFNLIFAGSGADVDAVVAVWVSSPQPANKTTAATISAVKQNMANFL